MKIGFISLGCAKNLVDSENIIALFDDPYFEYEECLLLCCAECGMSECWSFSIQVKEDKEYVYWYDFEHLFTVRAHHRMFAYFRSAFWTFHSKIIIS